jgi:hypothetical protein
VNAFPGFAAGSRNFAVCAFFRVRLDGAGRALCKTAGRIFWELNTKAKTKTCAQLSARLRMIVHRKTTKTQKAMN